MGSTWMRPRPARWFEVLVARDDTTLALEALAATGAVELEARDSAAPPPGFAELGPHLQAFAELALRYRPWWPRDGLVPSRFPQPPAAALHASLERLQRWAAEAEPLIRRLQQLDATREPLLHWHRVARCLASILVSNPLTLPRLAAAGPPLQARLAVRPAAASPQAEDRAAPRPQAPAGEDPLLLELAAEGWHYRLAVADAAALATFEQRELALGATCLAPPTPVLAGSVADAAALQTLLAAQDAEAAALRMRLDALTGQHGLHEALANVQRLQWVLLNVRALESGPLLGWITGWTRAAGAAPLEAALEASGARALVRLAAAPPGRVAPMLLDNPPWARPFEVFARAMGVPSATEADPSRVLALAVPLMFGYMFGDVGQGLVIAAAGWASRRRFALARLFISGGLAAALFGLVFGSVFGLHVLHPWWTTPLADPLAVLAVPLAGGAALLTLGLVLSALEAHWRGELARWCGRDAGLLLAFAALLAALAWPSALWGVACGALLYAGGHAWQQRSAAAAAGALGEWLERLLQLAINTLSFARVGAFALAHAGLAAAIAALMAAAASPLAAALVLVIGNVLVMALEGLVVSIQTTRLVLFEFFTRFLHGEGRVFRPLPLPPSMAQEGSS